MDCFFSGGNYSVPTVTAIDADRDREMTMEWIDYGTYTHRAKALRSRAIADFNRRIAKAATDGFLSLVRGIRGAGRSVTDPLKTCPTPGARSC